MSGARKMLEARGHLKKTSEDQTALVLSDVFFYSRASLQIGLHRGEHRSDHFRNEATENGYPEDSIMHRLQESPAVP